MLKTAFRMNHICFSIVQTTSLDDMFQKKAIHILYESHTSLVGIHHSGVHTLA